MPVRKSSSNQTSTTRTHPSRMSQFPRRVFHRAHRMVNVAHSDAIRFLGYFHRMEHLQNGHYPTAEVELVDTNGHSLAVFKGPLNDKGRATLEAAVEKAAKFPRGTLHTLFGTHPRVKK